MQKSRMVRWLMVGVATSAMVVSAGDSPQWRGEQRTGVQDEQDLNAASLVLMISYNNFKLLQMGDLAGVAEQSFLKNNTDLNADVIKIAHHGAADATSNDLLNRVQPKLAIISTTEDNWINAPSKKVLKRLKKKAYPIFTY